MKLFGSAGPRLVPWFCHQGGVTWKAVRAGHVAAGALSTLPGCRQAHFTAQQHHRQLNNQHFTLAWDSSQPRAHRHRSIDTRVASAIDATSLPLSSTPGREAPLSKGLARARDRAWSALLRHASHYRPASFSRLWREEDGDLYSCGDLPSHLKLAA